MARLLVAFSVVLFAACSAEDDLALDLEVGAATLEHDISAAAVEHGPGQIDPVVAEEAWALYEELAGRLEERGVTLEELQAAVDAEDEEALREMFGYTDAEAEAMQRRLLDLVERAQVERGRGTSPGGGTVEPEGWPRCDTAELGGCITFAGWAISKSGPLTPPTLLGLVVISGAICVSQTCSFDRSDPGPPVRSE